MQMEKHHFKRKHIFPLFSFRTMQRKEHNQLILYVSNSVSSLFGKVEQFCEMKYSTIL